MTSSNKTPRVLLFPCPEVHLEPRDKEWNVLKKIEKLFISIQMIVPVLLAVIVLPHYGFGHDPIRDIFNKKHVTIPPTTPDLPFRLPFPFPNITNPIPFLGSNGTSQGNPICDLCENILYIIRVRLGTFDDRSKQELKGVLDQFCDHVVPKFPALDIVCHIIETQVIDKLHLLIQNLEKEIQPKKWCTSLPICAR